MKSNPVTNASHFAEFVAAQDRVYGDVLAELSAARKATHWMWFIFPQLVGLGSSLMAKKFALSSVDEARAYLEHPILGPRLLACTRLMLSTQEPTISHILGAPDDVKFHSCMTLFSIAAPDQKEFREALDKFFDGKTDARTLALVQQSS